MVAACGALSSCGDEKEADNRPASARLIESDPRNAGRPRLVLGSKGFTEQLILAEIYSQALEAAGYRVRRGPVMATERVALDALREDEIDAHFEYTGTALTSLFGERLEDPPEGFPARLRAGSREVRRRGPRRAAADALQQLERLRDAA